MDTVNYDQTRIQHRDDEDQLSQSSILKVLFKHGTHFLFIKRALQSLLLLTSSTSLHPMRVLVVGHAEPESTEVEQEVHSYHGEALEEDCRGTCVLEVGHYEHSGIEEDCKVTEKPFKPSEEGRIVEGPL